MPARNHKKNGCGHSHSQPNMKQQQPINSISNLVSTKSPSISSQSSNAATVNKRTPTEPMFLTRCPHVCLIGDLFLDDIMPSKLRELKRKHHKVLKESNANSELNNELVLATTNPIESDSESRELECDECEQSRNLWLCLREDCMYVGCGGGSKDENSFKHSTTHAQNSFHPLAINLATKAIWCEFCNNKIILEKNNPPYQLQTRKQQEQQTRYNHTYLDNSINHRLNQDKDRLFDDLELIGYLDQECNRVNRLDRIFGLNSKKPKFKQNSNFLFNYQAETESDPNGSQSDEDNDRLNNYFMYDDDENSRQTKFRKNGQIGLVNLGNTCYMNSALQCLSNSFQMTSYFLECADYIQMRFLHKTNYFDAYSTTNIKPSSSVMLSCLSLSYIKLVRELWEDRSSNRSSNKSARRITHFAPNEFVQVVKYLNPMFRGYMQHDSQEFLCYFMDQLHEELKRPVWTEEDRGLCLIKDSESEEEEEESESESENESEIENGTTCSSNEVDSGIHRLSIKSSTTESSLASIPNISSHRAQNDGDDESADSFESCQTKCESLHSSQGIKGKGKSSVSDLSDSQFSDAADDTISSVHNNVKPVKGVSKSKRKDKKKAKDLKPVYTSIMSEMFEGKLIGQVQCLECRHLSTTTESFQHLSLPIPTKEYLQTLQQKACQRDAYKYGTISDEQGGGQGWIGWMADLVKGYIWTQTIKLQECLAAFFSDDDLCGDNMYSCERCKKLTNGVKYSRLLDLPETLIIHLKRFRHDSMFSTGKISSHVSFPLDDLDMGPFLHTSDKTIHNETQYELNSIICHYGVANGGHYIAYARNFFNDEWYEYDDSYCKKVDFLTVQNTQAYVLFYKKKSTRMDQIKDELRSQIISKTSLALENSLLQSNYISKQWLHKLKYFAEPGPIDNTDFLCKHNFVQPCLWRSIDSLVVVCSTDTWLYLLKTFGMKRMRLLDCGDSDQGIENCETEYDSSFGVCNYLYPCKQCQIDDELMKQRQIFEKNEFLRLTEKTRLNQLFANTNNPYKAYTQQQGNAANNLKLYAISTVWFKRWEQFVQFKHCPQKHQIPGPINNMAICNQQMLKNKVYQLNKNSNYYKLTEEVWTFIHGIYGGGPALLVNALNHSTRQSLRTMSTSSNSSMQSAL